MCGRYYVDDETAREIEKLVRELDQKRMVKAGWAEETGGRGRKDIHPSDMACVLSAKDGEICINRQQWGYPGFGGSGVIFNARSEGVLEKKMFREDIRLRRCVIPAAGFYEWDREKNKVTFFREAEPLLFFAGCYCIRDGGARFVILTGEADEQMKAVHDRMPVMLERQRVRGWLLSESVPEVSHGSGQASRLKQEREYEQQSFQF